MTGTIAGAIADEQVLEANSLASVTRNFVVIRNPERQCYTVIPLGHVVSVEMIKKPYSGLLVISAGLFVVSAAAFTSKQGDGAALPTALVASFLVITYFFSRRASVSFILDSGATETVSGTIGEASALVSLVETALRPA